MLRLCAVPGVNDQDALRGELSNAVTTALGLIDLEILSCQICEAKYENHATWCGRLLPVNRRVIYRLSES